MSYFYPRPPRGGRLTRRVPLTLTLYFYPRPPRGGRLQVGHDGKFVIDISIHALREEGDRASTATDHDAGRFLSTPSARRATESTKEVDKDDRISIHALREEGDRLPCLGCGYKAISIHALREEGDIIDQQAEIDSYLISIHALREEGDRGKSYPTWLRFCISIHALREEGDLRGHALGAVRRTFLSTPSARRATRRVLLVGESGLFLSTPSARRATTAL